MSFMEADGWIFRGTLGVRDWEENQRLKIKEQNYRAKCKNGFGAVAGMTRGAEDNLVVIGGEILYGGEGLQDREFKRSGFLEVLR